MEKIYSIYGNHHRLRVKPIRREDFDSSIKHYNIRDMLWYDMLNTRVCKSSLDKCEEHERWLLPYLQSKKDWICADFQYFHNALGDPEASVLFALVTVWISDLVSYKQVVKFFRDVYVSMDPVASAPNFLAAHSECEPNTETEIYLLDGNVYVLCPYNMIVYDAETLEVKKHLMYKYEDQWCSIPWWSGDFLLDVEGKSLVCFQWKREWVLTRLDPDFQVMFSARWRDVYPAAEERDRFFGSSSEEPVLHMDNQGLIYTFVKDHLVILAPDFTLVKKIPFREFLPQDCDCSLPRRIWDVRHSPQNYDRRFETQSGCSFEMILSVFCGKDISGGYGGPRGLPGKKGNSKLLLQDKFSLSRRKVFPPREEDSPYSSESCQTKIDGRYGLSGGTAYHFLIREESDILL